MNGEDGCRAVRGLKKERRRCKPSAHRVISLDFDIRRRYRPALLVEKDFLDVLTEKPCNLDSQGETRIVPARLDGVDCLAGDANSGTISKLEVKYRKRKPPLGLLPRSPKSR
jgi:hypothetical protein